MPAAALLLGLGVAAPGAGASAKPSHRATTALPAVHGGFGTKPSITFSKAPPPKVLTVKVLHQGTGPIVHKAELLVCNYYAQIWDGKVFDTSFGRGLFDTPIGVKAVISGWDKGIVGTRVGSRLLLVIPPADGYGSKGDTQAGITGTDTLVFVIDVVGAYSSSVHGDPHATVLRKEVDGIKIEGPPGGKPIVDVTKGAPQPSKPTVTLVARGHGPKIKAGLVVDQFVVTAWSGATPQSTWTAGTPDAETIGNASSPNVLSPVIGMPLGSRVLVEIPKGSNGGPYALVVDLVAEPKDPA